MDLFGLLIGIASGKNVCTLYTTIRCRFPLIVMCCLQLCFIFNERKHYEGTWWESI